MIPLKNSLTKALVAFAVLFGATVSAIAQDYNAKAIPFSAFAVKVCAGDNLNYTFRARDLGNNGFDTDYEFLTNNPLVTVVTQPGSPNGLTGTIPNNTQYFFVDIEVHLDPSLPPGVYEVVMQLTCAGVCTDPPKLGKLKVRIVDEPEIEVIPPADDRLCAGDDFLLKAEVTNNVMADSYLWSTGETTPSILINTPGLYEVTVTGLCGSAVESVNIIGADVPQLLSQMCTNFGNALEFAVEIDENNAGPLNFQWFEDGMPISNGGDFSITSPNPGESVLFVSNVTETNHNGNEFTVTVTNACGEIVIGGCFAVPVDFVSFEAREAQDGVQVEWSTATEVDNDYFTVERSFDGVTFEAIAQLQGAGYSLSLLNYEYLDTDIDRISAYPQVYYRVKQTDFDQDYTYTPIVTVSLDNMSTGQNSITQVQANDFGLNIKYQSAGNNDVDIAVYDLNGQLIIQGQYFAEIGSNEYTLSLPSLAEGIYLVELRGANYRQTEKFAKF